MFNLQRRRRTRRAPRMTIGSVFAAAAFRHLSRNDHSAFPTIPSRAFPAVLNYFTMLSHPSTRHERLQDLVNELQDSQLASIALLHHFQVHPKGHHLPSVLHSPSPVNINLRALGSSVGLPRYVDQDLSSLGHRSATLSSSLVCGRNANRRSPFSLCII